MATDSPLTAASPPDIAARGAGSGPGAQASRRGGVTARASRSERAARSRRIRDAAAMAAAVRELRQRRRPAISDEIPR